ncbi:unnamed protein product, partial [Protopolystoma xenopodis]
MSHCSIHPFISIICALFISRLSTCATFLSAQLLARVGCDVFPNPFECLRTGVSVESLTVNTLGDIINVDNTQRRKELKYMWAQEQIVNPYADEAAYYIIPPWRMVFEYPMPDLSTIADKLPE